MTATRQIEIFSAGCPICNETIALVHRLACSSCDIKVLDMTEQTVASRAKELGIRTVPAVLIDGQVASCCTAHGPNEKELRQAGVGQPLS